MVDAVETNLFLGGSFCREALDALRFCSQGALGS